MTGYRTELVLGVIHYAKLAQAATSVHGIVIINMSLSSSIISTHNQ